MKQRIQIILIIIFLSVACVAIISYSSTKKKNKLNFSIERSLEGVGFVKKIKLNANYSLLKRFNDAFFAVSWEYDRQGKLYKFSQRDQKFLLLYDFNSDSLSTIIDYYQLKIANNQLKVFLSNNAENTFEVFLEDSLLYFKKFKVEVVRMCFNNLTTSLVTTWSENFQPYYYKYNMKKSTYSEVLVDEGIINSLKYPGVQLDGMFTSSDNNIFLVSYYTNTVLVFDKFYNFENSFNLNFQNPSFGIVNTSSGLPMLNPNNLTPNLSVDILGDYLYVLTNDYGRFGAIGDYYIDKYEIESGKYIASAYIPINDKGLAPKELLVLDDNIYLLSNEALTIYERRKF